MIEMLEGFLACLGAALFLGLMLAEMKGVVSRLASRRDGEDSGAPESDQMHFRTARDNTSHPNTPVHQTK
ncbi:hypothetical protein GGD46_002129 [Rhizobium lusitanum]|uniref:Uncharacterized protein n=1 Tax=Rhizobium lusitanum TaxID=293958 RepID=A0A7X0IPN6_9HYPH|nr:hypothetical protein [Rhizobium lusitanum]